MDAEIEGRDYEYIGAVFGSKKAERVRRILDENGVNHFIHGSRGYGIFILKVDVERARSILKPDAEKNCHGIFLNE